jgi:hypothetical protein
LSAAAIPAKLLRNPHVSANQPSTQEVQHESLGNDKIPQISIIAGIWFGTRGGRFKLPLHDHLETERETETGWATLEQSSSFTALGISENVATSSLGLLAEN